MAVLATPVYVDGTRYEAGTTPPNVVADQIRTGGAWVGGTAPALSTGAYIGKRKLTPDDLTSAANLRAALGITDSPAAAAGAAAALALVFGA